MTSDLRQNEFIAEHLQFVIMQIHKGKYDILAIASAWALQKEPMLNLQHSS